MPDPFGQNAGRITDEGSWIVSLSPVSGNMIEPVVTAPATTTTGMTVHPGNNVAARDIDDERWSMSPSPVSDNITPPGVRAVPATIVTVETAEFEHALAVNMSTDPASNGTPSKKRGAESPETPKDKTPKKPKLESPVHTPHCFEDVQKRLSWGPNLVGYDDSD
jgi:hypothetical protein